MDILQSLQNTLDRFLEYIPQLIGAIIILVIGYIVARILKAVVSRILQSIGFDGWMEKGGIKQFLDRAQTRETPASVLGTLVFWLVFIIAITMAADALGIQQVSEVLAQLIAYIPSIIAAILILILAALLANFLSGIVRGATRSEEHTSELQSRQYLVCRLLLEKKKNQQDKEVIAFSQINELTDCNLYKYLSTRSCLRCIVTLHLLSL